ncbi:MAG: phosphotransferase [Candidatus Omnitrophica bacterium]|nr:phosphotransferase [Candidatus Omnitrophota bacterium]
MTISLTQTTHKTPEEVCAITSKILLNPIVRAEQLGGGANSRVFRLISHEKASYIVKFYFSQGLDTRDRMGVEFSGLSFLRQYGITCVPRPITFSREEQCAIYEFMEGKKIRSGEITQKDMDEAVDFLRDLKELGKLDQSRDLSSASESCFSIRSVVENIQLRMERLHQVNGKTEEDRQMRIFLADEFRPFLDTVQGWCRENAAKAHISFDEEIGLEERTLSPSDFGFHNALRTNEGRITFLDFEYFGWDDPAKMISDFLFHPAMEMSGLLKKYFVRRMEEAFHDNAKLMKRVVLVYPLFGLKWCLIFLNEFIPDELVKRHHASLDTLDRQKLQRKQLDKAKTMLQKIKETYKIFPYRDFK